jgi:hypothetical protein
MACYQRGVGVTSHDGLSPRVDTSIPHPARRYDYWLGGKDNFQADRDSGDAIAALFPTVRLAALENRRFLRRAVTTLTRDLGIRQFLDIGTGIPTADNTHEVAQRHAPETRVVYVDNDPIVMAHARALLTATAGATAYIEADLRDEQKILNHPDLLLTLDLDQPVAVMLVAVLHFLADADDPYRCVRNLLAALPTGSYLTVSHATEDFMPAEVRRQNQAAVASGRHGTIRFRSRAEVADFFNGLELVEPGIVAISHWRADGEPQPRPAVEDINGYAAMARL